MDYYSKQISKLIEELSSLPGIGSKSAQRLAFHILNMPEERVERLADTILDARRNIRYCKTCFGLRLRACGEHPQAADSVGINVYKMRYAGVVISGALGAIGGLAYIVPPVQTWNFEVGVAGAGFLAMAVMIFGQWKPFNICGAAMFFAVFKSLANIADSTFLAQLHWSSNIYNMMPFIASMIILAFTSKNSMAPKAEGIPYDKGSR